VTALKEYSEKGYLELEWADCDCDECEPKNKLKAALAKADEL